MIRENYLKFIQDNKEDIRKIAFSYILLEDFIRDRLRTIGDDDGDVWTVSLIAGSIMYALKGAKAFALPKFYQQADTRFAALHYTEGIQLIDVATLANLTNPQFYRENAVVFLYPVYDNLLKELGYHV